MRSFLHPGQELALTLSRDLLYCAQVIFPVLEKVIGLGNCYEASVETPTAWTSNRQIGPECHSNAITESAQQPKHP